MTTNIYLDSLLYPLCDSYGGCHSSNTLPPLSPDEEKNFIVNQSADDEVGTHFVCIVVKRDIVFYFDPFGLPCSNENIQAYMSKCQRSIYHNTLTIQDVKSKMCGFYCALIVLQNDKRCKDTSKLTFDTVHLLRNDKKCIRYICKTIEQYFGRRT